MTIREISAEMTIPLRQEILRKNKPLESCYFQGDNQKDTFHLGVFFESNLIGICSLFKNEKKFYQKSYPYQLRGMAISEACQGKQIGKKLMEFIPEFLKERAIFSIWCNARVTATLFYQKLGFEPYGESFDIPAVGMHQLMFKDYE